MADFGMWVCRLFYNQLLEVGEEFLEEHIRRLEERGQERGARTLGRYLRELRRIRKRAEGDDISPPKVMGLALWLFQILAQMGVLVGIGPDGPKWCGDPPGEPEAAIPEWMDKKLTIKLAMMCSSSLNVQFLPREWFKKKG